MSSGNTNQIPYFIRDATKNDKVISVNYGGAGLTDADWVAAWNGYQLRAIATETLQKILGNALPIFKRQLIVIATVTTNDKGYATISGNMPTAPSGYSLFLVGVRSWSTTNPIGSFTVTTQGTYVCGAPNMTITNLSIDCYWILSNDIFIIQEQT